MTKRYYIYRTNHVAGRIPLSCEWATSASQAVQMFIARGEATGEFLAETKKRPVNFWLY